MGRSHNTMPFKNKKSCVIFMRSRTSRFDLAAYCLRVSDFIREFSLSDSSAAW